MVFPQFQYPTQDSFPEWRKDFERQLKLFLNKLEAVVDEKGKIFPDGKYRIQSKANSQTYLEFGTDGKIARVSNGVVIDNV